MYVDDVQVVVKKKHLCERMNECLRIYICVCVCVCVCVGEQMNEVEQKVAVGCEEQGRLCSLCLFVLL